MEAYILEWIDTKYILFIYIPCYTILKSKEPHFCYMRVSSDIFHIHESTNVACAIAVNEWVQSWHCGLDEIEHVELFILFYF